MKRLGVLFLIAVALPECGCASSIAKWGTNIDHFENREEVRAKFGNPSKESFEDGVEIAEYRFHGKVGDDFRALSWGWAEVGTLLFGDLVLVPIEVFDAAYYGAIGRRIVFRYLADGRVQGWDASEIISLTNRRRDHMCRNERRTEQPSSEK